MTAAIDLRGRSFLKELDHTPEELRSLLDDAAAAESRAHDRQRGAPPGRADGGAAVREVVDQDPTGLRDRLRRPGRQPHLPRSVWLAPGSQGVGRRHRPGDGPLLRCDRIPGSAPGRHRGARGERRHPRLQRAHRRVAPDPDARRLPHDARGERQARRGAALCVRRRPPVQHGPFAARHGCAHGQRRADDRSCRSVVTRRGGRGRAGGRHPDGRADHGDR